MSRSSPRVAETPAMPGSLTVLILAPGGRTAASVQRILEGSGIESRVTRDVADLAHAASTGVGAILIAEEALTSPARRALRTLVAGQPAWSDLPLVVLCRRRVNHAALLERTDALGNTTFVERPVRASGLLAVLRLALRARRRQYETRGRIGADALLGAIVNSTDDAIVSKDLDGIITSWNAGAERLFGWTAAEAIGRAVTMLIPPHRVAEETEILERIRRGERVENHESLRVRKDGSLVPVSITVSPIVDARGQILGASKIVRDISDRQQAEAALRASENRLTLFLEQIPVGVGAFDPQGRWILQNRVLRQYMREMIPSLDPDARSRWEAYDAEGRPLPLSEWPGARALAGRPVREPMEMVHITESGRRVWMLVGSEIFRDEVGRILGGMMVVQDIDARKRGEIALRESEDRSRRAEEALRDADRRKNEFLAVLAHELRNPLAPIRSSLEILALGARGGHAIDYVKDVLERQVRNLTRLVDDLTEISRITQGKVELKRERVEIEDVVRAAVEICHPALSAAQQKLTLDLGEERLPVDVDPIRMGQVFANLIHNASRYSDTGGAIHLSAQREDGDVVVRVRDAGIGIPDEMLPRIFDMFTQVPDAPRRTHGGLGIGLTLVRNFVELHGGSVTARSEGPGRGSEFMVRLPLAGGPAEDPPPPGVRSIHLPPTRILVVDDNVDAAESTGMLLEILGAKPRVVNDGAAALAAMTEFAPEIVLLDLGMPGMDGHEVARRIRARPEWTAVTLVAVTGWGQQEDRRATEASGFDHHLVKPVTVEALRALIVAASHAKPEKPELAGQGTGGE